MKATGQDAPAVIRNIRIVVYVMLVLSAAAAVFFGDKLWAAARLGTLPVWAPLVAPAAFTAFLVVYTVDRWLLVRRKHYPLTRALFQVAFALVFLSLLWPQQASELRQARHAELQRDPALQLLGHPDENVRAAVCELMGLRAQLEVYERIDNLARNDKSPRVRSGCGEALSRLRALGGVGAALPPQAP